MIQGKSLEASLENFQGVPYYFFVLVKYDSMFLKICHILILDNL